MTSEQTVTFIEILNQIKILSFHGENPMVLNLGAGTTVEIWVAGITALVAKRAAASN